MPELFRIYLTKHYSISFKDFRLNIVVVQTNSAMLPCIACFVECEMKTLVEVSVVVATYSVGKYSTTLSCLKSLQMQTKQPHEIILVVENDKALIEHYSNLRLDGVRVIVNEGSGLASARNTGVRKCSADVVAFIDDDAYADSKWLESLSKVYIDPQVIGVGGSVLPAWENGCPAWFPREVNWVVGCSYGEISETKRDIRNPIGCNMSFRRSAFEIAGCFNPTLGRFGKKLLSCEETAFSIKALAKIRLSKIVYEPEAFVIHRVSQSRTTLKYLVARSYNEGLSKGLLSNIRESDSSSLSTEQKYLAAILQRSIPRRIKRCFSFEGLAQISVLLLSTAFVLLGFAISRTRIQMAQS